MDRPDLNTDVCYSGGAAGSDYLWASMAQHAGFQVINFSFEGHDCHSIGDRVVLNKADLSIPDRFLKSIAKKLGKPFPLKTEHNTNLIRRNYYQIVATQAVYAIGTLDGEYVQGGTGWAIELARERHIPIYLFDIGTYSWWQCNIDLFGTGWTRCLEDPPHPKNMWTDIGSRKIPTDVAVRV